MIRIAALALFASLALSAQPATRIVTVAGQEYRLEFVARTSPCEPERNCRGPKHGTFVEVYREARNVWEVRIYDKALMNPQDATEYAIQVLASPSVQARLNRK